MHAAKTSIFAALCTYALCMLCPGFSQAKVPEQDSAGARSPISQPSIHQPDTTNIDAQLNALNALVQQKRKSEDYKGIVECRSKELALIKDGAKEKRVAFLLDRQDAYIRLREFTLAAKDLDVAANLMPNNYRCFLLRGVFRAAVLGDSSGALKDFNRAHQLNPRDREALVQRAKLGVAESRFADAITDYTAASKLDPHDVEIPCLILEAQDKISKKDPNALIIAWSKAIKASPGNPELYHHRAFAEERALRLKEAIADALKAFSLQPDNDGGLLYHAATLNSKSRAAAFELINQGLKQKPQSVPFYVRRARLYLDSKQVDLANKDVSKALQLDPNNVEVRHICGDIKMGRLDYEGALSDYSSALKSNPDDTDVLDARANAYRDMGDPQRCLTDLQHIVQLHKSELPRLLSPMALCYADLQRVDEAEKCYKQAIACANKEPEKRALRFQLAKLLVKHKRYSEAIEIYDQLRQEHPDADVCDHLASCYGQIGNWPKTVESVTDALKFKPNDAFFCSQRAEAYLHMRQYQRAIDDYTNAVKHGREQSPKYLQARASAYEQWGRKDLAEQDRKAALKSVEDVMLDR